MVRSRAVLPFLMLLPALAVADDRSASVVEKAPFAEERFENQIRPVLLQTCFPCHGGKKTSAGLAA